MSSDPDTVASDWKAYSKQLKAMLREVEFVYDTGFHVKMCPVCEFESPTHADDCELATLLDIRLEDVHSNRVIKFDAEAQAERVDNAGAGDEHAEEELTNPAKEPRAGHGHEASKTSVEHSEAEESRGHRGPKGNGA